MLVLSRKVGQEIRISDTISISVVRIRGNRVQLGIQAPEGITVYRTEIIPAAPDDAEQAEPAEVAALVP